MRYFTKTQWLKIIVGFVPLMVFALIEGVGDTAAQAVTKITEWAHR